MHCGAKTTLMLCSRSCPRTQMTTDEKRPLGSSADMHQLTRGSLSSGGDLAPCPENECGHANSSRSLAIQTIGQSSRLCLATATDMCAMPRVVRSPRWTKERQVPD